MSRIPEITDAEAGAEVLALFQTAQSQMGLVPNVFRAMAQSPVVLSSFMNMQAALEGGILDRKFVQRIAVLVAQFDRSSYCLAVNTAVGLHVGLTDPELKKARHAQAADKKDQAGLQFVLALLEKRGAVDDTDFAPLLEAGYSTREISEVIGNVTWNLFANYFNLAAQTTPDFPAVALD